MTDEVAQASGTLRGRWDAGHEFYDHIQSIEFGPTGRGRLVFGDGQAVKFEEGFRYSVCRPGRLRVAWLDGTGSRDIGFELTDGTYPVEIGCMEPSRTEWARQRLRFAADPFPKGCLGPIPLLDYYRW